MRLQGIILACAVATAKAHPGHDGPHGPHTPPKEEKPLVVAVVYSDFQNPHCAEVGGLIQELMTEKKQPIQTLFKHAPGHPDGLLLHEASLAAAQQGKFWEMHDFIFANPKANYSALINQARGLGLDAKRFQSALDERTLRSKVVSDITESKGMGVVITPTLFINGTKLEGIESIRSFVAAVLAPPPPSVDPNKIHEFDLTGSPATGPADAPVTLVEFSDFRCGFCNAHSQNLTDLCAAFPGKIRRVFKHFPLQATAESRLPHLGAMAAMKQGKFWEMYYALMKHPLQDRNDLMARARGAGLDLARFEKDLESPEVSLVVDRDSAEGDRFLIRMTPTTFINGKVLTGRHSLESLRKQIEGILKSEPGSSDDHFVLKKTTKGSDLAGTVVEFFGNLADVNSGKILRAIEEFYKSDVHNIRIEFRHLPDLSDETSMLAHRAVMVADREGKSWEMAGLVSSVATPLNEAILKSYAMALRMDGDKFAKDLSDPQLTSTLEKMGRRARERSRNGKSVVFVNGLLVPGVPRLKELQEAQKKSENCCDKSVESN